jgi:hypothetical protein
MQVSAPKHVVSANVEALSLLFDIVNVQNWSAAPRFAQAVVAVARLLATASGGAAGHLSICPVTAA